MYILWYCCLFAVAVIDVCSPLCAFSWSCLYYYGLCFVLGGHVFAVLIKLYKHHRCSSKLFSLITGAEKSVTVRTQFIEFVGFLLNSSDMTVRLTCKKAENIVQQCKAILQKNIISIGEFAQLIGKFVAAEPGVQYAPLFYKPLEIQRDYELKINKGNFDSSMALSSESIDCID